MIATDQIDALLEVEAPEEGVSICEPRGALKQLRYLVVSVKPRSLRLFRTGHLWSAMEVRDAWRRGNFTHVSGETRRLPNPPLCR